VVIIPREVGTPKGPYALFPPGSAQGARHICEVGSEKAPVRAEKGLK